jgi:hypothetical protein
LRIAIADPSGAAIPGASIRVTAGSASFTATTDVRGRAVLYHLPAGEVAFHAEARDFVARTQTIALRPGENRIAWQLRMAPHHDAITVTAGDEQAGP